MTDTNYAVAPGEYLEEWADEHPHTADHIATQLGYTLEQLTSIITGHTPITTDIAHKLEQLTTIPAHTWLRYEHRYRADLERLTP